MKTIPLTQGKVALIDDADYAELSKHKWYAYKCKHTFYARSNEGKSLNRHTILMHRVIMNVHEGQEIDHRNGDGLDNQRHNLRDCTSSENAMNRKKQSGTSQFKGVSRKKRHKKWVCQIQDDFKKRKHIGYFASEVDAAKAYDAAAIKYHKEFAKLNFQRKEVMQNVN